MAASSESVSVKLDTKYVVVDFDDGDSGRIAFDDIRFLLSNYPIVGMWVAVDNCNHYLISTNI